MENGGEEVKKHIFEKKTYIHTELVKFAHDKGQFSFQSQRKAIPKNVQRTAQLHSFHTSKVMLKILQTRLQEYVNWELPDVQARFRKGRRARDQIANIRLIIEKAREF